MKQTNKNCPADNYHVETISMVKRLKYLQAILICCLGIAITSACQDGIHYTEYKQLPHKQWDRHDTLVYHIPPLQHDTHLNLTLGIRSNKDFNYKTIVAQAELRCDSLIAVTIPVTLKLDNDSIPFSSSNTDHLSKPAPIHLKANKTYTLYITHSMRLNPLDGIPCIGIFLEK